jgi:hypothetical protein
MAGSPPVAEYFGPTPYTSKADSSFITDEFGFCIETFEDGAFDVPGATGNATVIGPFGGTDSVDGDDGVIDGDGGAGHSYFSFNGPGGIDINFDPLRTNGLPTSVGIVWTDGAGTISFEAFGPTGLSLGINGPNSHAGAGDTGQTAEDRFYGASFVGGISRIKITNTAGGIEADHIQLDRCILCGDANLDLHLSASDALTALRVSVGTGDCELCVCDTNSSTTVSATDALAILRKSVGLTPTMNCPPCVFVK